MSGERFLVVDNATSSPFLSAERTAGSVLDVHTLRVHPIDWSSQAALQRADGFVRVGPTVVSFSPGKTQLVFLGSRYNHARDRTEYALMAVNFVSNQLYAVPFQAPATQFLSAEDVTADWAATYFDWTMNPQGKEVLSLHAYTQHPSWPMGALSE